MATYLARYHQGEYQQVWAELGALGARIREPDLVIDATGVAHETMTRVAANVTTLFHRLQGEGYQFLQPTQAFCPPAQDIGARLAAFETQIGMLPLSIRAWYEIVGSVDFTGSHPILSMHTLLDRPDLTDPATRAQVEEAGYEFWTREFYSDPLVIEDFEDYWVERGLVNAETTAWWAALKATDATMPEEADRVLRIELAPDWVFKAGFGGGDAYHMWVPNLSIDGQVHFLPNWYIQDASGQVLPRNRSATTRISLVEYLRICCRWGGFPGFAEDYDKPPHFLRDLAEGLLPF